MGWGGGGGGVYERMVKTVKSCLRKVLGQARLNYEEMETVLTEIEMAVNSRPLTYMQDDIFEILTPSHLLLGRRLLSQYNHIVSDVSTENDNAIRSSRKRMDHLNELLRHYFSRFECEYVV